MTIEPFFKSATLSPDRKYRFELKRMWRTPPDCIGGAVMYIGHNPSDADEERNDPTIHRMMDFANRWGYGRISVVNLLPVRTSNPEAAHAWWEEDWSVEDWVNAAGAPGAIMKNAQHVISCWEDAAKVVACWGAISEKVSNLSDDMRKFFAERGTPLHIFGLTRNGHPVHPLARGRNRVPDDVKLQVWP